MIGARADVFRLVVFRGGASSCLSPGTLTVTMRRDETLEKVFAVSRKTFGVPQALGVLMWGGYVFPLRSAVGSMGLPEEGHVEFRLSEGPVPKPAGPPSATERTRAVEPVSGMARKRAKKAGHFSSDADRFRVCVFREGCKGTLTLTMRRDQTLEKAIAASRKHFSVPEALGVLVWDGRVLPLVEGVGELGVPERNKVELRLSESEQSQMASEGSQMASERSRMASMAASNASKAAGWDGYHSLRGGEFIGFR